MTATTRDHTIDSPDEYRNLPHHERGKLQAWIKENIAPRKTPNSRTSTELIAFHEARAAALSRGGAV